MCGIVGFLKINNLKFNFDPEKIIRDMVEQVKTRGPDFQDYWSDLKSQIYLGHSRLAVIDLNSRSNQPISSLDKRWTIVYNGEIYNYRELKKLLPNNQDFTGDTSVLVSLIENYGFKESIKRIEGMFSIAAWDMKEEKLYLVRDRLGEKPLYYSITDEHFIFGSNINSIVKFSKNKLTISQRSISSYLKLNYIPAPYSIYENVKKLTPGNFLEYDLKKKNLNIQKYWVLNQNSEKIPNNKIIFSAEKLLTKTIEQQMVSDVDIGTFLSGGVDSSLITALAGNLKSKNLKTFTLGSDNYNFDESIKAKNISEHLGFKNLNYKPSKFDILDTITKLPKIYGEPFGDSSQIPTILLSKFAKDYVKVILSGDGGDETFGGYNRYNFFFNIYPKLKYVPDFFLKKIGLILKNLNPTKVDFFFKNLNSILSNKDKKYNYGYLVNKLGRLLEIDDYQEIFYSMITNDIDLNKILINKKSYQLEKNFKIKKIEDVVLHDLQNYLPDDILCKVDRASMAFGLEVRAPFIDKNLVEFSQKIPFEFKIRNGDTKFVLKSILKKYLPKNLYQGQKRGFSVPIALWLRTELKEMIMDLSSESIIKNQNIFDFKFLYKILNDHMNQTKNNEKFLWSYLVFQNWYFQNK
jgi:asparagine synthase (glutamine-hydrolysing)